MACCFPLHGEAHASSSPASPAARAPKKSKFGAFRFRFRKRFETEVVNKTDYELVLREKHRTVWQEDRYRIEKDNSVTIPWRPNKSNFTLGTFVKKPTQDLEKTSPVLYITSETLADNEKVEICRNDSDQTYTLVPTRRGFHKKKGS